ARTIFGLTPADQGELLLNGEQASITSPADAIGRGIAYLPEDRRRHGVIAELPISANITLASLDRWERSSWSMDFSREREIAGDYVRRFGIKTPALYSPDRKST